MDKTSTQTDRNLADTRRKVLDRYLRGNVGKLRPVSTAVVRRPAGQPVPLTLAQERIWLQEALAGGALIYNESVTLQVNHWLDVEILERSFAEIVRRHEIWRTSYDMVDGQLVQVVHPVDFGYPWKTVDLRHLPQSLRMTELARLTSEAARQRFDLKRGPLLRVMFVRLTDTDQRLFLFAHLSILDGVSVYQILPIELDALYEAFSQGKTAPLPSLPIQFADYALWERQQLACNRMSKQMEYWREQLRDSPAAVEWPRHSAITRASTYRGALYSFRLSSSLTEMVRQLSRNHGVTLFTALVASFGALLYSYTRQSTLIIGTPSACGRKLTEVRDLLGHFLNPVALRISLEGDPSFSELLHRSQRLVAEAVTYDDIPIDYLTRELRPNENKRGNGFFSIAISLQPRTPARTHWLVSSLDVESGGTPWDMYLAFIDQTDGLSGRVQYNSDFFTSEQIARTIQDLEELIELCSTNADRRVSTMLPHLGDSPV
jgi:Condensation domain